MSQPLSPERRKLFDDNLILAKRGAGKFIHRFSSRHLEEDEVLQVALEELFKSAAIFNLSYDVSRFRPFAAQRIRWALMNKPFFRRQEVSGSEPVAVDDDDSEALDTMGLALNRVGRDEIGANRHDLRLESRILELREAIRSAAHLDVRQKRVLRLTFFYNLSLDEISARLGISRSLVSDILKKAITQLRRHFRARGLATLPLEARMPKYRSVPLKTETRRKISKALLAYRRSQRAA